MSMAWTKYIVVGVLVLLPWLLSAGEREEYVSMSGDSAYILRQPGEEFLEKYDAEDEYTHVPDKVYDVEITLANKGAEESVGVSLNEFRIQGLATGGSLDRNLLMVANPALGEEVSIALRKNTEMVFHLPFGLYEENFRKKNSRFLYCIIMMILL